MPPPSPPRAVAAAAALAHSSPGSLLVQPPAGLLQPDWEVGEDGMACGMGARICVVAAAGSDHSVSDHSVSDHPLHLHPSARQLHHLVSPAVAYAAYGGVAEASLPHSLPIGQYQDLAHRLVCSGRRAEGFGERTVDGIAVCWAHSGFLLPEHHLDR